MEMNSKPETYLVKTSGESSEPIRIDGIFFAYEKDLMLKKFSKQPNPELRVQKIVDNAREIFGKIRLLEANRDPRNLLLVGKVQSGKTSNMEMTMALAFDNGYDAIILFGGYDTTLLYQALSRFSSEAFPKPEGMSQKDYWKKWVNIVSDRSFGAPDMNPTVDQFEESSLRDLKNNGGKILAICLKSKNSIDKVAVLAAKLKNLGLKTIIFDDEGDQASLNTEFRKGGSSKTYSSICNLKEILGNPPYVSVTATPEALVYSPSMSQLKPADLCLLRPGEGYTGLSSFHLGEMRNIKMVSDEISQNFQNSIRKIPTSLLLAIAHYFLSSAIMSHLGIRTETQMIIHTDKKVNVHKYIFDMLTSAIDGIKENIDRKQDITYQAKLKKFLFKDVWDDHYDLLGDEEKRGLKFEDIDDDLRNIITNVHIIEMNRRGQKTGIARYPYKIFIGADLLQRGVSFDELVTTYFTRSPKRTGNMDTQTQRARWLGYRSDYLNYCRVFTTPRIASQFSDLAEVEEDLWAQMYEVQRRERSIDSIFITSSGSTSLRPSRKSVITIAEKRFGRKWFSQRYLVMEDDSVSKNNIFVESFFHDKNFEPIRYGAGPQDPDRTTGYKTNISYDDFVRFVQNLPDIFGFEPFGGINRVIDGVSRDSNIQLITFFDPSNFILKGDDQKLRKRSYYEAEGGLIQITALMQGADKADEPKRSYNGDSYVLEDENTVTIQISAISPRPKESSDMVYSHVALSQYMVSIHFAKAISIFVRGDE